MIRNPIIEERQAYLGRNLDGLQKTLARWGLSKLLSFDISGLGWANLSCTSTTAQGDFFVRFTLMDRKDYSDIEVEVEVLQHLAKKGAAVILPLMSLNGNYIEEVELEGRNYYVLLFPAALGEPAAEVDISKMRVVGETLGQVQNALLDFPKRSIGNRFDWQKELDALDRLMESRLDKSEVFWQEWKSALEKFRRFYFSREGYFGKIVVNHGDLHLGNLRFDKDKVVAVLDFDNLVLGPKVLDVAIAAHYLDYSIADGERFFEALVSGYRGFFTLDLIDLEVLMELTQFYLWRRIPWIRHFSDISATEEKKLTASIIAGIHRFQDLKLG